ncbi:methylamine dehydrogenase [Shewanella corallii]|uniref:Methylamine dehydrogenase n=1 Tax=Shewanella corallii TaxID=560080 RepID=A0ABT0N4A7_9GAMM|nr:amine dehydrogenase large subunit [Shewanella corallii]MCL2913269.1 methylamine dehydrogenase [Shewanella corallii]
MMTSLAKNVLLLSLVVATVCVVTLVPGSCRAEQSQGDANSQQQPVANPNLPPLPLEPLGRVVTLPRNLPNTWMYVDEGSFFSMFGGKVILMDVTETKHAKRIKGIVDKNLLGNFLPAKERDEFYIVESFHERGSRGKKTDYLVIYDSTRLSPIKELVLPKTRLTSLPRRHAIAISPDEKLLYVANFTPAASFTVVDLDTREIVSTIETPGCVLTYPTGRRSVTSICNNGGLMTSVLTDDGDKKEQVLIPPFFDTDDTPIFERPAIVDGIAYFPGFKGEMHELDLRGDVASYKGEWSLLNEQEQQTSMRPGGLALMDVDDAGRLYIIMNPEGFDGSQTHGGSQVWVVDPKTRTRIKTIEAPNWAISIAVTRGKEPKLVVTNGELNLDVIDVATGKLEQTLADFGNQTPLVVFKAY